MPQHQEGGIYCTVEDIERKVVSVNTKTCTKCGEEKLATLEFFHKRGNGLRSQCKVCNNERCRQWRLLNIEKVRKDDVIRSIRYRQKNKEKVQKYQQEYYIKNREKKLEMVKKWSKDNKNEINKRRRQRHRKNPNIRLINNMRSTVRKALQGKKKIDSTFNLIGCTIEELSQFTEGMSWENYGNPKRDHSEGWHIDHIRPCSSFDLSDPDAQRQCFHYTNLQPLWGLENISKGARYED